MQIIDEIKLIESIIDVELGKFDAKLNKKTSDINDLKNNDKTSGDWHKLTPSRLESISNTCDRIEHKYQVQDYGMEDLFIKNINDQLTVLKTHILEIVNNANLFATQLTRTNTCIKKTKINEVQVIEEVHCAEEKEESDQDYAVSADTPLEDYSIENMTAFFEVTEVHTHLPQYSEDLYNLINIQDARMCKPKPARGKGYTARAS
ncbi:hypothetical protein O181_081533 [Austropuccinia psidii MF-1]|uniref:Uncharacterized protein n=1 Tax=Austropuccinia psidii MF-1 TaxID=1389203 RepID=A0A9Q3FKS8_9BASI|nr:hypothetical protein [Austropuccinia psidii MF-1]